YKITKLPPGEYLTTFYYADLTVERRGVVVAVNKTTPVYQKLDLSKAKGEVIRIVDKSPTIDPTSTTQGITIRKDTLRKVPGSRSFENITGLPPPMADRLKPIVAKARAGKRDVVIEVHG